MQRPLVAAATLLLSSPIVQAVFKFENSLIVVIDQKTWNAHRHGSRNRLDGHDLPRLQGQILTVVKIDQAWFSDVSRQSDGGRPKLYAVPPTWRDRSHPVNKPPYGLPRSADYLATRYSPEHQDFVPTPTRRTAQAAAMLLNIGDGSNSSAVHEVATDGLKRPQALKRKLDWMASQAARQ